MSVDQLLKVLIVVVLFNFSILHFDRGAPKPGAMLFFGVVDLVITLVLAYKWTRVP